ncbi:hypothetical protein I4U23_022778 [Adineta vaga]|nr:hypothetical protein I4U23_022778 [Adineta vaga]
MSMKSLPAELWLMVFPYLSTGDLIHIFHSLNSYFRRLLIDHFQLYSADLKFISEYDFDEFYQYYSPLIRSFRLCSSADYPSQTNAFLSQNLRLDRFVSLQFLLLEHIESLQIWQQLMTRMNDLSNLTHLSICRFEILYDAQTLTSIFNQIWCLPKLVTFI